jgi:cell division protein FtsW
MTTATTTVRYKRGKAAARLGRADRSSFGLWFWEIDRVLLALILCLVSIGLVAVAAASPATAQRYSGGSFTMSPLNYFWRQLMWVGIGIPIMLVISTMPKLLTRRFAMGAAAFFSVMLAVVPVMGVTINGATRWVGFGISQFQPSEFLKPFYVVSLAWFLSLREKDGEIPVFLLSGMLTGLIGLFLMMQPDFGQTVMFSGLWLALAMIAGLSGRTIGTLAGGGIVGLLLAYFFYPVANQRINNFLFAGGDTYQVDTAHATITGGGFLGTGPGGGEMKFRLPEAHTDYIFSVIGEEFGLVACAAIAILFLALGLRVFIKLLDEEDRFTILAVAGLTLQLVMQAIINMAVNVGIAPSKGMTLPFISYGGSSFIALCMGAGMLLALTRKNPYLLRSPYVSQWSGR